MSKKKTELTDRQKFLGEFYRWIFERADYLRRRDEEQAKKESEHEQKEDRAKEG